MAEFPNRFNRAVALLVLLALIPAGTIFAQAGSCGVVRDVSTRALDELVWKQLNAIYEKVSAEAYDEAYDDLQKMLDRTGRDAYLQAILNQALAQVEWSRGNYPAIVGLF